MLTLKDVFIPEIAKVKDEFIEWVVDYKELNGTLEFDGEYNDPIWGGQDESTMVYYLVVDGESYKLEVESWEGSMFVIGGEDYEYDEDGNVLMDDTGYPQGTIYTKSVVARLYNVEGDLLEEEEYFEHGLDNDNISYRVSDDEEHLLYFGNMGYTVLQHQL